MRGTRSLDLGGPVYGHLPLSRRLPKALGQHSWYVNERCLAATGRGERVLDYHRRNVLNKTSRHSIARGISHASPRVGTGIPNVASSCVR